MKRSVNVFVVAGLMASALAGAQTMSNQPQTSTPSNPSNNSGMESSRSSSTGNYTNGSSDNRWQMKDCLAKQKASNPQLTKDQMKQNCMSQQTNDGQPK
jgi:hypothetical protein